MQSFNTMNKPVYKGNDGAMMDKIISTISVTPGSISFRDVMGYRVRSCKALPERSLLERDEFLLFLVENYLMYFDMRWVLDTLGGYRLDKMLKRVIELYHSSITINESFFINVISLGNKELVESVLTLIPPDTYLKFRALCGICEVLLTLDGSLNDDINGKILTDEYKIFLCDIIYDNIDLLKRKSMDQFGYSIYRHEVNRTMFVSNVVDGDIYGALYSLNIRALSFLKITGLLNLVYERYPEESYAESVENVKTSHAWFDKTFPNVCN